MTKHDISKIPPPPLSVLDRAMVSSDRFMPLHHQVRGVLRRAIDSHFAHGQTFWTETMLIERLGVSRITVRQALAELTREGLLLRQAARGSFVQKDVAAPVLGVFVPRYDSDFYTGMLKQIARVARSTERRLEIYHTDGQEGVEASLKQLVRTPQEEHLLVCGQNAELFEVIEERGYRYVLIDALFPGYTGPFVGTDNGLGVRLGLEHLIQLGHRRITLLVNEPEEAISVQQRIAAFTRIIMDHGLSRESRVFRCHTRFGEDSFSKALAAMPVLWADAEQPTAIFAVSDPGAWGALKWLAQKGIRVPEAVSVLGFEDVSPSRFTNPALTTVAHPMADIARHAVQMLMECETSREGTVGEKQVYLAPELVIRESTGPVSAATIHP